jgi:hypothetical protein
MTDYHDDSLVRNGLFGAFWREAETTLADLYADAAELRKLRRATRKRAAAAGQR